MEDLKEKLVEVLDNFNVVDDWYTNGEIADILIAHAATFAEDNNVPSKWISVNDRLPENDQLVLCFMKYKGFGTFRVFQWNYIDWQWNDGNEWYDENDVTHWMPLPPSPKGE